MQKAGLYAILSCTFLIAAGCGHDGNQAQQPPADSTVAVDIYAEAPLVRIGYVAHDHQAAVYIAALRGDRMREEYGIYLAPLREGELYALVENGEKVAEIEFFRATGGGSVVPTSMAAGEFDLGFGGVVPFVSSTDAGTGIAMVSPLHTGGDMLVVAPDNAVVTDWASFTEWVRSSEEPVNVGYKNPQAVAKNIFEAALVAEGIPFSQGTPEPGALIVMINMQGEANLIPGLTNGTIDAYVSNNPWCELAEANGSGRCVCELADLPPGTYVDHPCCSIAATLEARTEKAVEVAACLRLFAAATDYINANPEDAASATAEWLGNPVEVEIASMATSGYDTHETEAWKASIIAMIEDMAARDQFAGPLASMSAEEAYELVTDFSLLPAD